MLNADNVAMLMWNVTFETYGYSWKELMFKTCVNRNHTMQFLILNRNILGAFQGGHFKGAWDHIQRQDGKLQEPGKNPLVTGLPSEIWNNTIQQ